MTNKSNTTGKGRAADFGDISLRMMPTAKGFAGRAFRDGKLVGEEIGEDADAVWMTLHNLAAKSDPRYFGFDGAISRFLKHYPGGFEDQAYVDTERRYKVDASEKLRSVSPEAVADGVGYAKFAMAAVSQTDLLNPLGEKVPLGKALQSPAADTFMQAAARFTLKASPLTIGALASAFGPEGKVNWAIATYLPFLWQPDRHMLLKPEITREFAARVGHTFDGDYESGLSYPVYESLLDLVETTRKGIAALKPRDNIDIHTFIFVVGRYKDSSDRSA